ncbi:MAG: aminoglycoside phosphotransferase family protein [Oscillospiraceae bacterium]|nr:aminoglycoside phosphotransferase family protein [Oscillospiraceae bacterium]
MDEAIRRHFGKRIASRSRLTGGYVFDVWLLELEDGQKVVFRAREDFRTGGGRMIDVTGVFERERFFYGSVNRRLGRTCPEVYVVDGTRSLYRAPFQVSEYMEGIPLNKCYEALGDGEMARVRRRIGMIAGGVNGMAVAPDHPYIKERGEWGGFFARRLAERLKPLVGVGQITEGEAGRIVDDASLLSAEQSLSFIHLDIRYVNMIYGGGELYLLDAENSEFGDPLFELAVLGMNGNLSPEFLEGYAEAYGWVPDMSAPFFKYYQMERAALVLDLFLNVVKDDGAMTERFLKVFGALKLDLLN